MDNLDEINLIRVAETLQAIEPDIVDFRLILSIITGFDPKNPEQPSLEILIPLGHLLALPACSALPVAGASPP
jgi:hypothetical protein